MNAIKSCKISTGFRSDHSKQYNSILFGNDYQDIIKRSIQEKAEINKEANDNV